jgi:hypothetical protein
MRAQAMASAARCLWAIRDHKPLLRRSLPTVRPFDRIADQVPKSSLDVLAAKLGFVACEQTQQALARVRERSLRQRQPMRLV